MNQMIFAVAERGERIMAEYIDREALVAKFDRMGLGEHSFIEKVFSDGVRTIIAEMPAADVVPVVHGRWEYNAQTIHTQSLMRCSICGWWTLDPSVDGAYHYCPNCGAKMDLEEEHGQGLRLKR